MAHIWKRNDGPEIAQDASCCYPCRDEWRGMASDINVQPVLVGNHLHEGHRIAELADLVSKGVLTLRVAEAPARRPRPRGAPPPGSRRRPRPPGPDVLTALTTLTTSLALKV